MENIENIDSVPQKVYEMYSVGQSASLDDIYSVENVATDIKEMERKIEFYKGLKKKKEEDINNAIHSLENRIEFYKEVITKTLKKCKEKTVNFPGVCKISSRTPPPVWSITDEEEFVDFVKKAGEKEKVIEEITTVKILKKEANKLLSDLEKAGKVPSCVSKIEKDASISITFYEQPEETEVDTDSDPIPVKEPSFDKLAL